MRIRVNVAEPTAIIRAGLESIFALHEDLVIASVARDGMRAVRDVRRQRPDLVLLDLGIARIDGFRLQGTITRLGLATRTLIYAMSWIGQDVQDALAAGAAGFIGKSEPIDDLLRAMRAVVQGELAFSNEALQSLRTHLRDTVNTEESPPIAHARPLMTERELMVLQSLAHGLSIVATGRTLHMSPSTVKNHRQSVFAKLSVANAPAAVYEAMRQGLLVSGRHDEACGIQ